MSRVSRGLTLIAVVLVFVVLAGATYQGVATALERRRYQRPGRLVPAGSVQLHLYCTGKGSPTVVLEAPATGMSASWGWVQPKIAEETRVCSYDRAGLGWSEWGETTFDPVAAADQLHALLTTAGEPGPYVLAGEGFGALLARIAASRFPSDTAALVLIDPPAAPLDSATVSGVTRMAALSPWLARTGVLRLSGGSAAAVSGLPQPAAGALQAFLMRPDHLTRAGLELTRWTEAVDLAAAARIPESVPVVTTNAAGPDRTAMLTSEPAAARAAHAITDAVGRVRAQ
jgi:pimeloyl-ACP methyl ester carboxylesterase